MGAVDAATGEVAGAVVVVVVVVAADGSGSSSPMTSTATTPAAPSTTSTARAASTTGSRLGPRTWTGCGAGGWWYAVGSCPQGDSSMAVTLGRPALPRHGPTGSVPTLVEEVALNRLETTPTSTLNATPR